MASVRWLDFETAAPDLAGRGRERLAAHNVMLLGTLRADGSPRISPVNPFFAAGELMFGVMRSAKADDLLRDRRCALHNAVADGDGAEGEFKLFGTAVLLSDPTLRAAPANAWWHSYPIDTALVFAFDIESAAFIAWDWDASKMATLSWSAERGLRRDVRPYP